MFSISMVILLLIVTAIGYGFSQRFMRETSHSLKFNIGSPTAFYIGYRFNYVHGVIRIIKSKETLEPKLAPTKQGWDIILPLNVTYAEFVQFIKICLIPEYYKHDKHEAIDLLKTLLGFEASCSNRLQDACGQFSEQIIAVQREAFKQNMQNFVKPHPDVFFVSKKPSYESSLKHS